MHRTNRFPRRALGTAITLATLVIATFGAVPAGAQVGPIPTGWKALSDDSHEYSIGTDVSLRAGGQGFAGATIKSNVVAPAGDGMLVQSIQAEQYRGKRVRLSGFLKTTSATGMAYLWIRVDGAGAVQSSDFMQMRGFVGTAIWSRQDLVLDVPESAVGITFGFLLSGQGQVWLDDVALDVVGQDVAVTGRVGGVLASETGRTPKELADRGRLQQAQYSLSPAWPVNMDFTEIGRIRP